MDVSLDSGIMDAVGIMAGVGSALFVVVGIVFLVTLFGNMVSWSFGVNFVAEHAAKKGNMPRPFARESEKNQMPTGAAVINGVVASALVLLAPVMELAGFDGFFWIFFSMNIVFLLISYIPMFPAFLKLRRDRRRTRRACSRCRAAAGWRSWWPRGCPWCCSCWPSSPPSCR